MDRYSVCKRGLTAAALLLGCMTVAAQAVPTVTGNARVDELLSKMTLEEKIALIHGAHEDPQVYQGQAGYLAGVPRLGIPGLRLADGPPGVLTRVPSQGETATMGVAATFSARDAEENGVVIGREDRAAGIDVSLQPFVNIDRDLEFGRGFNTFGEDPYLTSVMGAEEIKGIQSQHVMAMVKHYIAYDSDSSNIYVDDQTLHEVYLAPFDAAVKAGVASIMCSYNRVNGAFACGNEQTLTTILRDQIGFKGFMTSDWGAVHAVNFINAGLDMEMPGVGMGGPSFFSLDPPPPAPARHSEHGEMFGGHVPEEPAPERNAGGDFGLKLSPETMQEALHSGTVNEAAITRAAGRVLLQIVQFGYMDGMHNLKQHAPRGTRNCCLVHGSAVQRLRHRFRTQLQPETAARVRCRHWLLWDVPTKHLAVLGMPRGSRRRIQAEERWAAHSYAGHFHVKTSVDEVDRVHSAPVRRHETLEADLIAQNGRERLLVAACERSVHAVIRAHNRRHACLYRSVKRSEIHFVQRLVVHIDVAAV